MSSFLSRQKLTTLLVNFSKEGVPKETANVAAISPTPFGLINMILEDDFFVNRRIDTVIVMGCGDGRWLVECCKIFSCLSTGVDINEERLQMSKSNVKNHPSSIVEMIQCRF
jgi:predicted RNA methylase